MPNRLAREGIAFRTCELSFQSCESINDVWGFKSPVALADVHLPNNFGVHEPGDGFVRLDVSNR